MRITYCCEWCGESVTKTRTPGNMPVPPRFCSQSCSGASRRGSGAGRRTNAEYDCETCGKHVSTYRSQSAGNPRFCSVECTGAARRGARNPSYSGGRHVMANGYVVTLLPGHPDSDSRGYIYEHRLIAEQTIGRRLANGEVVHHQNGIKIDNRPENLRVMESQAAHMRLHSEHRRTKS